MKIAIVLLALTAPALALDNRLEIRLAGSEFVTSARHMKLHACSANSASACANQSRSGARRSAAVTWCVTPRSSPPGLEPFRKRQRGAERVRPHRVEDLGGQAQRGPPRDCGPAHARFNLACDPNGDQSARCRRSAWPISQFLSAILQRPADRAIARGHRAGLRSAREVNRTQRHVPSIAGTRRL